MALLLGTIVLWLAALSRVIASIRRPDSARISMTVAAVCIALAFTTSYQLTGRSIDAVLHWPYSAELIQHLLFAAAVYATLRFLTVLRLGALTPRAERWQAAVFAVVGVTLIALFAAIPMSDTPTPDFLTDYATSLPAVGYRTLFYVYLVFCLVGIALICRRSLRTALRGDRLKPQPAATAVSVIGIGLGSAAATVAAAAGAVTMISTYAGLNLQWLAGVNLAAISVAAMLAGLGILAPYPVEVLVRWILARRTAAHLAGLWSALTDAVPEVVLPLPSTRSPVARAELISARRRIEIADALHRIRITPTAAATIRSSADPAVALGHTLRDPTAWAQAGGTGVPAVDLLPEPTCGESELPRFWALADAYGRA